MTRIITIKNTIKRLPQGMELNRRLYYIEAPLGLEAKVFRAFKKPQERFAVMRIVSLIRIFQKQNTDGENLFVNISSDTLYDTAGNAYRTLVDWLISNNVVEENSSYSTDQKFSKSFRLTPKALKKGITVTRWDVADAAFTNEGYSKRVSETVFTPEGKYDTELLYCLSHENILSIPDADEIIESLPDDEKAYASEWFYRINLGKCLPNSQSKSSRFYFNSIMMQSKYRKHLVYNNSTKLVNFDVKCCHPAFLELLANVSADGLSKYDNNNLSIIGTYVSLILIGNFVNLSFYNGSDFYDEIGQGSGMTRDQIKKEFNRYKNSDKETIKAHYFTKRYEEMGKKHVADFIIETPDLWKLLEELETALMCSVCNRAMDEDLVFIRQHDGFLTTEQDAEKMKSVLAEHPHNLFQYKSEVLENEEISKEDNSSSDCPLLTASL